MIRRLSLYGLTPALLIASLGCRSDCGGGWFTSRPSQPSCQLMGRSDGIVDSTGMPIQGAPGTFVPGPGMPLVPGMVPGGPAPELPYPQPTDLIPRPGVPVPPAIPVPAPGEGATNLLPAPKTGVPVKGNK